MIHPSFTYGHKEHQHYATQGYYIFPQFLDAEGLASCQKNVAETLSKLGSDRSSDQIINAHQLGEDWIFQVATQPEVLDVVERQAGPNIALWSTHLLCKAPKTGKMVPWHQDEPYWNVTGRHSAAFWIPFDDVDAENGGMSVIPNWHTKGVLPTRETGKSLFTDEIEPSALPDDLESLKVSYHLNAGQCAMHHTMIPHNSPPNRSERWRRTLILRYVAADGEMGEKTYEDFRDGSKFQREYYLVRGRDVANRGLKQHPFPTGV